MRVLYDYQIMCSQKYGGISRYYFDLIEQIERAQLAQTEVRCIGSRNRYFEKYFHKKACNYNRITEIGVKFINQIYSLPTLLRGDYDIVQPTYYDPYLLKFARGKVVFTVYDMIQELFPEIVVPIVDRTIPRKRKLLRKCDHIIAISESTKRDILKFYPDISPDKISVIYIGSSFRYSNNKIEGLELPERYVLFVGRRGSYKNFNTFFQAMKPILEEDRELSLVCVGGGGFQDDEKQMMSGLEGQIIQFNADDEMLAYAYSHAQCFVFPSKYEGFGIPTLEAFTCGCPVLLSNTSSLPEVGGDAVLYFDPENADEIRQQIIRVLKDEALRTGLSGKGTEQLKKFSWEKIAKQVTDCYKKVLSE